MTLPWAAHAQAATPQALIMDVWTDFSSTCVPYLINPEKALAQKPATTLGYQQHQTPDRVVTHRHKGFLGDYDRVSSVEVHIGQAAAMVACEVHRSESMQPFPADVVSQALREMISQLAGVQLTGGTMTLMDWSGPGAEGENYYNGEGDFSAFVIEGALPSRIEFIEVEVGEGFFGLYVSASVAREDWK